jgi:serine protease Do
MSWPGLLTIPLKELVMIRRIFIRNTIAAAVFAAAAGGYFHHVAPGMSQAQAATTAPLGLGVSAVATPTDFSGIVQRFGPAVVNISVTGKAQRTGYTNNPNASRGGEGLDPNDPFFEFFQRFGPQMPRGGPEGEESGPVPHGQGSGFIISADGIILTNAHVVADAQEVMVKLTDRREFKAKVLGADRQSDVAVIKIDARDLPTVMLGDPARTMVGEPVLAIGSPYGFENTATSGIVSAKSRSLPDDPYVSFMQTDVAVNPGNSGGPLFNLRGEVIGINSQIFSRTGGYQGLSFAIPIDVANKVQLQLVQHGKVTRGHLGVGIQELNQALADSFGLKKAEGALIGSVEKGSPAERGGLQPGDVVISFNGEPISHSGDLSSHVGEMKPGSSSKIGIIRHGEAKTVAVTLDEMQGVKQAKNETSEAPKGRLGVVVRPLAREEQAQAGLRGGLLVEQSVGAAAKAGIQAGDVILSLNGTPVADGEQFRGMVAKAGKNVALLVQRGDAKIFIPVNLG